MKTGPNLLGVSRLVVAALVTATIAFAHDVITTKLTWNREISRVVYKRCASCHREGGSAMSLMSYDEARPWAKAMRDQVVARSMPPWGAVKGVGSFQNDPSLTEIEIQMIVAWGEGGAPKGDDDSIAPKGLPVQKVPPRAAAKPAARKVQIVEGELQLDHPIVLQGLRPESLDDGQSMLVDAWMPDGRIEHLIWLRDYRKAWTRDYLFRVPLKLPVGTTVHVKGPSGARVLLIL